jgi:hypothetical protein
MADDLRVGDSPDRRPVRLRGTPRRTAGEFVTGLPRRNCWTLVEHAGDATPDKMQNLLSRACWDAEAVRDDVRDLATEHLGDTERCWWSTRPAT